MEPRIKPSPVSTLRTACSTLGLSQCEIPFRFVITIAPAKTELTNGIVAQLVALVQYSQNSLVGILGRRSLISALHSNGPSPSIRGREFRGTLDH